MIKPRSSWQTGKSVHGFPCCTACGILLDRKLVKHEFKNVLLEEDEYGICTECLDRAIYLVKSGWWGETNTKIEKTVLIDWVRSWSIPIILAELKDLVPEGSSRSTPHSRLLNKGSLLPKINSVMKKQFDIIIYRGSIFAARWDEVADYLVEPRTHKEKAKSKRYRKIV